MVYRPPYLWYIDPPYPWYFDPLPMVYRPPYPWYFHPPTMVYRFFFKNFNISKISKKLQNFHKISKLTYFIRLKKKKIQNFHRILRKFSKFQNLYIMNLIFFLKLVSLRFPI